MPLFISIGVFAVAIFLMAVMLARKHLLLKRGIVFSVERVGTVHAPILFSALHDIERALLHKASRLGGHLFFHAHTLAKKGVRAVAEKTPARKIIAAVSGKNEQNAERSAPSTYLKD